MVKLYFRRDNGKDRLITVCEESDVMKNIHAFIKQCNEKNKKRGNKEFISYYTRTWADEDGRTWYDVGSYTEFFWTEDV